MSGGEQSTAERIPRLVQRQMDHGSWEAGSKMGTCRGPEEQGVMGEQSRSSRLCNVRWTIDQRKLQHKGRMEGTMPTRRGFYLAQWLRTVSIKRIGSP